MKDSKMSIQDQFNRVANEYDKGRRLFLSCFDDFYGNTTRFITSNISNPLRIADLGAGTGLLTQFWYSYFPDAEYYLTDLAEDMLNVAKERFHGMKNINFIVQDYTLELPLGIFDVIMSALSIHHIDDANKQLLFNRIYDKLNCGGIFVNYDQFCTDEPELNLWFDQYWENQLANSGLTEHDLMLWKERRRFDKECSLEKETKMLSNCGFKIVKCVYAYQKFAVVIAKK